ncbi:MAG: amidohydrolase family protein, partial [Gammaproteobacteria bacterium]
MTRLIALISCLVLWNLGVAQDLVITNAHVIDGAGAIIERGSVVVIGGLIASVSEGDAEGQGTRIDAKGMTVMPGLINTHWHLLNGNTDEAIDEYIETGLADVLKSLLGRGVTTIMSASDAYPNILELRRKLADGEISGPRLIAVGRH